MFSDSRGRENLRFSFRWLFRTLRTVAQVRAVKRACAKELAASEQAKAVAATIVDFAIFCKLLAQPENHIRIKGQYVEKQVRARTEIDMVNEAARLLSSVEPHSAYVRFEKKEGGTGAWTGKVRIRKLVDVGAGALLKVRARWSKQNCEFLVGFRTGLLAPFDKVFVKRVRGQPVSGHDLLMKLTGRALPFSPAFLGYVEGERESHVYFFENLAPGYATLESELNSSAIICQRIINDVVRKAAVLFRTIYWSGFVYTDFCTKNIMIERGTRALAIIDIDSCVPLEWLLKPERFKARGQEEFWGLWNQHLSKTRPVRVENAQKSVVVSFAALWCRALALRHSGGGAALTALKLVHNPSYEAQRPLWVALSSQNKEGFLEYFRLRGVNAPGVYAQWQGVFNTLKRGQEVAWQEIVSATENLVTVVGRKAPSGRAK